jgi:aerobic carbon-monoxide dehydrogenase large subunit
MTTAEVGRARLRKEDAHLITGRSRYTDNITLPGMLHLAMVRSPFAHAKITSVDVAAAKSSPGVVAVLTGADVAAQQGSLPNAWPITPDQKAPALSRGDTRLPAGTSRRARRGCESSARPESCS